MALTPSDQKHFEREKQSLLDAIFQFSNIEFEHTVHQLTPAQVVLKLVKDLQVEGYHVEPSDPQFPASIIYKPSETSKTIAYSNKDSDFKGFDFIEKIGEGAFGVVLKAKEIELNRFVAIKFVRSEIAEISIKEQAKTLAQIDHENVVQVFRLAEIEFADSIFGSKLGLVMPFLDGKTLENFLNEINPNMHTNEFLLDLSNQIIEGVLAIHGRDIVHADIHCGNIMIVNNKIKIIDIFNRQSLTHYSNATQKNKFIDDVIGVRSIIIRIISETSYSFSLIESIIEQVRKAKSLDELKAILNEKSNRSSVNDNDFRNSTTSKDSRNRDLQTIEDLLTSIPENVVQLHLQEVEVGFISDQIFYFWEGFRAKVSLETFHMHNVPMKNLILDFYKCWSDFFVKMENLTITTDNGHIIDKNHMRSKSIELSCELSEIRKCYSEMILFVKNEYPEINYMEIYKIGWDDYIKFKNEIKLNEWIGIDFEGTFLAWEGPFENLNQREPLLIQPYDRQLRLNAALKLNGNNPFYTNDPRGELVVYETDKKTWYRQLLGGGENEKQILAIKKYANSTSALNQAPSVEKPILTIDKCIFHRVISNGIAQVSFLVRNIGSCPAFSVSIENKLGDVFRVERPNMASRDESWAKNTRQSYGQFIDIVFFVKISCFNQDGIGFEFNYQITVNSNHAIDIKLVI